MDEPDMRSEVKPGRVFWFTGLSASGKTTLCRSFVDETRRRGRTIVMLDGDELRTLFEAAADFSLASRRSLAMRYARLCEVIASQGVDVAIATISLISEVHAWNRAHLTNYIEIYLKVSDDELRRRDPKGIYARASRGELTDVAGVDLPVDLPVSPHVVLEHTPGRTVQEMAAELFHKLEVIVA